MIAVGDVLVSEDILEAFFVCNLAACKGECCVQGDAGASLTEEEVAILDDEIEAIKPFLNENGLAVINREGSYTIDEEGDLVTPLVEGRECAYAVFEADGTASCGIEKAWKSGKTHFRKPISCHLYPIRVVKLHETEALNYHRWAICSPACSHGKELQVRLYQFLKEALIRKYGADWYAQLEQIAQLWIDNRSKC